MKKNSEIGSEFWENQFLCTPKKVTFDNRKKGFLCGRTALDYIICDAKISTGFTSMLLPSYCCHTMIEPFVRNGIKTRFYPVFVGKNGFEFVLPEPENNEALYLMTYFGFGKLNDYDQEEVNRWKFCILDETHSCFSEYPISYLEWNIKYRYTSYRKWADIRGFAMALKIGDDFQITDTKGRYEEYLKKKNEACIRKKEYMESGEGEKRYFLKLYQEAEELLDIDYTGYSSLEESVSSFATLDIEKVREKRRENGNYLLRELEKIEGVRLPCTSIGEGCPLFIPILVEAHLRDDLKSYLIKNEIYCPVHWPISKDHDLQDKREKDVYEQELSVICDQRYEIMDMKKIVDCISEFFRCERG